MCFGTTYENASMYWFHVPLKLLSKNSCQCLSGCSRSGSFFISVQRAKWMNDSCLSVFSSAGTMRPTKNSSRSGSTPCRLAVLMTVSADARPSWFGSATAGGAVAWLDMRAQLQPAPEGVHVGLQVVTVEECAGGPAPAVQQVVALLARQREVGRRDVTGVDGARAHARRARDEPPDREVRDRAAVDDRHALAAAGVDQLDRLEEVRDRQAHADRVGDAEAVRVDHARAAGQPVAVQVVRQDEQAVVGD